VVVGLVVGRAPRTGLGCRVVVLLRYGGGFRTDYREGETLRVRLASSRTSYRASEPRCRRGCSAAARARAPLDVARRAREGLIPPPPEWMTRRIGR
jgi:hypothetical protein